MQLHQKEHLHQKEMSRFTLFDLFTPLNINAAPITMILKQHDQRPDTIKRWTNAKSQELQYVGVLGALMAGLLCSAFTWPLASDTTWVVPALWYSGLVFIIASVATATQQSITLSRLTCLPEYEEYIRDMLGDEKKEAGCTVYTHRKGITFIIQIPVMMLRFGVYFFLVGLGVLLGYAAWEQGDIFSSETKVRSHEKDITQELIRYRISITDHVYKTAVMCAVVTIFAICCHAASVYSSYSHWRGNVVNGKSQDRDNGNRRVVNHV